MTKEEKDKWVAALRSGKFKQAQYLLSTTDYITKEKSYCCLGVCSKVLDYKDPDGTLCYPSSVPSEIRSECVKMNDNEGRSFLEIADYLEENLITEG